MDIRESVVYGLGLRARQVTEAKSVEKLDEADMRAMEAVRRSPHFASAQRNLDYHTIRAILVAETTEPISKVEGRAKRISTLLREGKLNANLKVAKRLVEGGGLGDPALTDKQDELGAYPDNKDPKKKSAEVPAGKSYADEARRGRGGRRLREDDSPLKPETPGEGDTGPAQTTPTQASNAVDVKEADDEIPMPEPGDGTEDGEFGEASETPDASTVKDGDGATDMAEADAPMPPPAAKAPMPPKMTEEGDDPDMTVDEVPPIEEQGEEPDGDEGFDDFGNPVEEADEDPLDIQAESVGKKLHALRVERAKKAPSKKTEAAAKAKGKKLKEALPSDTPEADTTADLAKVEPVKDVADYGAGDGKIQDARRGGKGRKIAEDDSPLKPETPGEGETGPAQTSPVDDPDSVEVKERYKGLTRTERAACLYLARARIKEGTDAWKKGFKQYVKFVSPKVESKSRAQGVPARGPFRRAR